MGMIDTHLHVLPGIDDGARDLAMSREMLRHMASIGFTHLVATPHLMEPLSAGYAERVTAACARDDRRRASFLGIVCAHLRKAGSSR